MVPLTRRTFLLGSAALAVAPASARAVAPSDRINVAVVGLRGRGNSLLETFAAQKDVAVTHLCDLDPKVLDQRAASLEKKTATKPHITKDYRTCLEDKELNAIVLGTPDHWHAIPTIQACQAGKDVYVEKPDGHNIIEGQRMVAAARKHERMVQLGTQTRSAPYLKEAIKFVADGGLGKVIFGRAWETAKQAPIPKVPDSDAPPGVDYNQWLGPAPLRPFNRYRYHGNWRWFFDYGAGDLGNDGVHRMDYCRALMGLNDFPQAVSASGGKYYFDDAQEWPDTQIVTFDWPGKVLLYEMRIWSGPRLFEQGEGAAVYGDEGWLIMHNTGWRATDRDGKVLAQGGDSKAQEIHVRNFLDAIRSRKREELNQEIFQGHVSSVMCHAGNIAWRTGKKLRFDPKTETFDDAEANKFLGREYRKGFELPTV